MPYILVYEPIKNKSMTKEKLKAVIRKDIKSLEREQKDIAKRMNKIKPGNSLPQILTYTITRKHTLVEVLKMIQ